MACLLFLPLSLPSSHSSSIRFLFNGDARPVGGSNSFTSLKGEPTYQYDRFNPKAPPMVATVVTTTSSSPNSSPSSSGGSSFKLSFSMPTEIPEKKKAEYDSAESDPAVYDYAFNGPCGPSFENKNDKKRNSLPLSSSPPPPVNLGTHPSRNKVHKRSLSNPGVDPTSSKPHPPQPEIANGPINSKHGGSKDSGLATLDGSTRNLEQDFSEIDKSLSDILSDLTVSSCHKSGEPIAEEEESLDSIIASLEEMAKGEELKPKLPLQIKRSNTLPSSHEEYKPRRANSTSTCHPIHYLEHKKMKRAIVGDEYVEMKAISPLAKHKANVGRGGGRGTSRSVSYEGTAELSPIKETTVVTATDYENYPQPEDVLRGTVTNYKTPYANITASGRGGAAPQFNDDDIYENNEPAPPPPPGPPSSSNKLDSLLSSTFQELDSLQDVLEQFGKS